MMNDKDWPQDLQTEVLRKYASMHMKEKFLLANGSKGY